MRETYKRYLRNIEGNVHDLSFATTHAGSVAGDLGDPDDVEEAEENGKVLGESCYLNWP